jgi:acetyltransferase-like isoleucine patch superfamily enzyme
VTSEIKQTWTLKKVFFYLLYRTVAKHLPRDILLLGEWFYRFRSSICGPLFKESAKVIRVGRGADFDNGCNIIMKDNAHIGEYAILEGPHGTITIGRHVMMGKYCIIIAQNHKFSEEKFEGFEGKNVLIDDYAWIGHRVTILPGVRIGKYAVIGAGAVVSKDIPDYAVAVGNPAVVKKYRKQT